MIEQRISHRTTLWSPQKGWVFLSIPNEILGTKRRVFLDGTLNGKPFQATANPWQGDTHIVSINARMRQAFGVAKGDEVTIDCAVSTTPPPTQVDEDIRAALHSRPDAERVFDALGRSHQREYLDHITSAKRPETRAARIEKMIEALSAR